MTCSSLVSQVVNRSTTVGNSEGFVQYTHAHHTHAQHNKPSLMTTVVVVVEKLGGALCDVCQIVEAQWSGVCQLISGAVQSEGCCMSYDGLAGLASRPVFSRSERGGGGGGRVSGRGRELGRASRSGLLALANSSWRGKPGASSPCVCVCARARSLQCGNSPPSVCRVLHNALTTPGWIRGHGVGMGSKGVMAEEESRQDVQV